MPIVDNVVRGKLAIDMCRSNPDTLFETVAASLITSFSRGALSEESPNYELTSGQNRAVLRRGMVRLKQQEWRFMNNRKKRPAINPPSDIGPSDPDYLRQCGFALEPSIHRVIEQAVEVGWTREDLLAAILVETGRCLECNGVVFGTVVGACSEERFLEPHTTGQGRLH